MCRYRRYRPIDLLRLLPLSLRKMLDFCVGFCSISKTGSASLAPPAGERGVVSSRCLSPLHWDPYLRTGSKLGRLLASTSKCLAQSNKSPERGTATKERHQQRAVSNRRGPYMRDRRTLPSRQRTYIHLHVRVDRLEDEISHFYKVINELRTRVSMLEKQLYQIPMIRTRGPIGAVRWT
jgi:hypothetical protein